MITRESSGTRAIVTPEVTSAATASSAANEAKKKTRDANDSPERPPRTVSDPETVADRLFRALAAERATIASLERRLDDAEGKRARRTSPRRARRRSAPPPRSVL